MQAQATSNQYLETRVFFGVYQYRTGHDAPWKAQRDSAGNVILAPKIPKIV